MKKYASQATHRTSAEIAAELVETLGSDKALNFAEKMAFNMDGIFRRTNDNYSLTMSIYWNEIAGEIVASKVGA